MTNDIGLQRYRVYKIIVCGNDSIPLYTDILGSIRSRYIKKNSNIALFHAVYNFETHWELKSQILDP